MDINKIPQLKDFDKLIDCNDAVKPLSEAIDKSVYTAERFKSGYPLFDESMNGGFKDGDLVVLSGISGQGKTTLGQTLTYNLCKQGLPCLWFSYEVSIEHLHRKFVEMGIEKFYHTYVPQKNTTGELRWVKAKIREGIIKHGTKFVFIDHLDFLLPTNLNTSDSQSVMLKNIATELKSLAIELKVVIFTMAHLKKLPNDKEPDMQDIGYSAGIFQLADYVVMVYRERNKEYRRFGSANDGELYTNNTIIKYVKNRESGSLKFIKCQYDSGKFLQLDSIHEEPKSDGKFFGERE